MAHDSTPRIDPLTEPDPDLSPRKIRRKTASRRPAQRSTEAPVELKRADFDERRPEEERRPLIPPHFV